MAFQGYGSQADVEQRSKGGRGPRGEKPRGFVYTEEVGKDKRNFLSLVFVPKDAKDREYIILDDIKSKDDPQFAALIHHFWYNGRGDNVVTSLEGIDERGCPYSHALRERSDRGGDFRPRLASAVWFLTVLDMNPFTYERGPNAGKTVRSRRLLLPVPRGRTANSKVSRVEEFMNFATKLKGGLRFQTFQVTGGASKIGQTWWPTMQASTIDELRKKFAADAAFYGFTSVDDYLKPADYHTVCKPKGYEDAKRLAAFIEADRRENPSKFNRLDDEPTASDADEDAPASNAASTSEEEGSTLPF